MLFEHGVCLGDSLMNGARTPYGLAEALSDQLNRTTNKRWLFRNEAVNGDTVLQLLRRVDQKPALWQDATFALVLIGTNDAKRAVATPPAVFRMLYGQLLDRFQVRRQLLFPALIPDIVVNASLASPYDTGCRERIQKLNAEIQAECVTRGLADLLVDTTGLDSDCYVDGVHFSTSGIDALAARFSDRISHR